MIVDARVTYKPPLSCKDFMDLRASHLNETESITYAPGWTPLKEMPKKDKDIARK